MASPDDYADSKSSGRNIIQSNSGSKLVQDVVASLNADKVWPSNVILYTVPEEKELLTDVARCHVVKALLAVHGLMDCYRLERRNNAEFMAPKNGMLPFLRTGKTVVAQKDILEFMYSNLFILKNDMSVEENMTMQGVISLIETKLIPIELYVNWVENENKRTTRQRYGYTHPEPLKTILYWQKSKEVLRYLKAIGLLEKSEIQIREEISSIYKCISRKLETNSCVIGEEITEADVYVYGHLQAILESKLEKNMLMEELQGYPKLTKFCLNFNQVHLGNKAMIWEFL